jgi:hypothetical protein
VALWRGHCIRSPSSQRLVMIRTSPPSPERLLAMFPNLRISQTHPGRTSLGPWLDGLQGGNDCSTRRGRRLDHAPCGGSDDAGRRP